MDYRSKCTISNFLIKKVKKVLKGYAVYQRPHLIFINLKKKRNTNENSPLNFRCLKSFAHKFS